jgi:LEA14-like dessication related protein
MAAIGLAGVGCATLKSYSALRKVKFHLRSVTVDDLNLTGGRLTVTFLADNPAPHEARMEKMEFLLFLNNHRLATGELAERIRIPARGHRLLRIPVSFRWSDVGAGLRQAFSADTLWYRVEGNAFLDTPMGPLKLKILERTRSLSN